MYSSFHTFYQSYLSLSTYLTIYPSSYLVPSLLRTRYFQTRRIIVRACSIPPIYFRYASSTGLGFTYAASKVIQTLSVVTPPSISSSFAGTKWKTGPCRWERCLSARFQQRRRGLSLYVPKNHLRSIRGFYAI